jgi:ribosomal protein L11 methyltransferase
MSHLEYNIQTQHSEHAEMVLAMIMTYNFEGYLQEGDVLKAYVNQNEFDAVEFETFLKKSNLSFNKATIQHENWNAKWESSFEPIVVPFIDNPQIFACVRANFHPINNDAKFDLLITPKMSFGTGHHPTTFQMIQEMSLLDFEHKIVLDYGTGTGVLAVLAEKLGAEKVIAIDYDALCYDNTIENIEANHCKKIIPVLDSHCKNNNEKVDILLANINLNVIISELKNILEATAQGAQILFSGILIEHKEIIYNALAEHHFQNIQIKSKENWLVICCDRA